MQFGHLIQNTGKNGRGRRKKREKKKEKKGVGGWQICQRWLAECHEGPQRAVEASMVLRKLEKEGRREKEREEGSNRPPEGC